MGNVRGQAQIGLAFTLLLSVNLACTACADVSGMSRIFAMSRRAGPRDRDSTLCAWENS